MKQITLSALIVALAASLAAADEIQLTNGRKITGKVVKKDGGRVIIEVGAGTITLDAKDVSSVNPGRTAIDEYQEKVAAIKDSTKASDFLALAKWAEDNKLTRYTPALYQRVIAIEPDNAQARAGLKHEKMGGKWMTFEEAQTARGLVLVEDRWITKAEVELIEKRRLEAKERAMAAEAERKRRVEEARAARQAAIDDYNARLAAAMSELDGYFYSPSFAFTTPYFRPYWWAPYVRSRSYYQHGWKFGGFGGYGAVPTIPLVGPRAISE
jgi:hypothetical protein